MKEQQSEVWQRVHAREQSEYRTLHTLMQRLLSDMAYLQQRRSQSPLQEQAGLRQLIQAYADESNSIKGILIRCNGKSPVVGSPAPGASLGSCYDNALQRLSAYTLRTADPVYGPVFRQLAKQTERHCLTLMTLLGMQSAVPKKQKKGR